MAHMNPDQPIVGELKVTDDIVLQQEQKVLQARIKLAAAMKTLLQAKG
jgi:hypothetical protein